MNSASGTSGLISVLLIDDHSLFRAGLAELLTRRGIRVVASVNNGVEGIRQAAVGRPDIILLDIRMPDLSGLEVLSRLRSVNIRVPVVMVTTSRDEQEVSHALRNGANGYLLKDMEPDDLIEALREVMRGETVVAPELAVTLARALQGQAHDDRHSQNKLTDLTPREKQILGYIAEGGSNKAIGRDLGITDGTVKLHVKSILRKLRVHSRVEAAVIAVENGLGRRSGGHS